MLPARYEQIQFLGAGANSEVYCAFDTQRKCMITWKWGLKEFSHRSTFRLRWLQEVAILQEIESEYVVSLLDYGVWADRPFMVFPFATQTLPDVIRHPQRIETLLKWLSQLLCAISKLHSYKIIHQDINPDNILIENEDLWLTDFSVARSVHVLRVDSSEISGTMGWSAPEQQKRQAKKIDTWTDIYAWGRVAHYLLQGSTALDLVEDILIKATASQCEERFFSASYLMFLWNQRIGTISSDILHIEHQVLNQIPVPYTKKIPLVSHQYPTWNQEGKSSVFSTDIHAAIQKNIERTFSLRRPQLLIIDGPEGGDEERIIREALDAYPYLRLFVLDYENFDGIMHCVREWVSPQKEDHPQTSKRIAKSILHHRNCSAIQKEKEAQILTFWGRRNVLVEPEIGGLFFVQHLQELSQKEPIILFLNQPQKNEAAGDGFELCHFLMSEVFLSFPIFIIASIHIENHQRLDDIQRHTKELVQLGANTITWKPTKRDFSQLIPNSNQQQLDHCFHICAGLRSRWESICHETIQMQDSFETLLLRKRQRFQEKCSVSTLHFVRALALSRHPLPLYACREQLPGLLLLLDFGMIKIRGRWIFFVQKKMQQIFCKEAQNRDWEYLAQLWRKADYEDLQIRNLAWCNAMVRGGHAKTALSILLKTIGQSFQWGRKALVEEGYNVLGFSRDLAKQQEFFRLYLSIDDKSALSQHMLWKQLSSKEQQSLIPYLIQYSYPPSSYDGFVQSGHKDICNYFLRGEQARVLGDWNQVREYMQQVQDLDPTATISILARMWWVEASIVTHQRSGIEDVVQYLMTNARQFSSVRGMACASYADALFCVCQGKVKKAIQKFRHAASMALLSNQTDIWRRALGYLSMILIRHGKLEEAQKVTEFKLSLSQAKQLDSTEGLLEYWYFTGKPLPDLDMERSEVQRLWSIYALVQYRHLEDVRWFQENIQDCFHPFAGLFVDRLGEDFLSTAERIALVKQISIC